MEIPLSEVLSGLSHALDLTEGQPRGHAERSCLIGMRLAAQLELDDATRSSIFYALLLKDAGCSSTAAKVASLFGADDAVVKSSRRLTDTSSRPQALRHLVGAVAPGGSLRVKARHGRAVLAFGDSGARSLVELRCERGAEVARAVGLDEVTAEAILDADEHWDGGGYPAGRAGEAISLPGRVLCLAQTAEVFWREGGAAAACDIARRRGGTWFDPALVRALCAFEHDEVFWGTLEDRAVGTVEPPDLVLIADGARLDRVAEAFASIVDAKSPYTARHSERVAEIAVSLADLLGLDAVERSTVRRASLLHDIGKLGVSNRILDKPGQLSAAEWSVVRGHPRWSKEILMCVGAFGEVARIAGAHHERLDGSGYFAGLTAEQLDLPARILAVADVAEALSSDRPYRTALDPSAVSARMLKDSGRTLDGDACSALQQILPVWAKARPTSGT